MRAWSVAWSPVSPANGSPLRSMLPGCWRSSVSLRTYHSGLPDPSTRRSPLLLSNFASTRTRRSSHSVWGDGELAVGVGVDGVPLAERAERRAEAVGAGDLDRDARQRVAAGDAVERGVAHVQAARPRPGARAAGRAAAAGRPAGGAAVAGGRARAGVGVVGRVGGRG